MPHDLCFPNVLTNGDFKIQVYIYLVKDQEKETVSSKCNTMKERLKSVGP